MALSAILNPLRRRGQPLRALRHRNYQLFFLGHGTSLIGSWIQRMAMSWLVWRLWNSELLLGEVNFCGQILTFLAAPLAGVLADRVNRRRLLVATQSLAMVQAFILAGMTYTGHVEIWHIITLSLMLGLVNAFDIPIRQSFVVEMLESRDDLPNALALNSLLVNGAKVMGPAAAGIVVAKLGEPLCFFTNGLSFLAVILALLAMRMPARQFVGKHKPLMENLVEGFRYAYRCEPIREILIQLATVSLLGMSYMVLMPVVARDILGGDARTQGLLMAATGIGAIAGAIFMMFRNSVHGLGKLMSAAAIIFGNGLIAFSTSRSFPLSIAMLVIVGFGTMVQMVSCNTFLQTLVDDDKRGRVMSLYTMAFMGMGPFGALLAGFLASRFGTPTALMIGGIGCVISGLAFAARLPRLNRIVHDIYVQRGLLQPETLPAEEPTASPPSAD